MSNEEKENASPTCKACGLTDLTSKGKSYTIIALSLYIIGLIFLYYGLYSSTLVSGILFFIGAFATILVASIFASMRSRKVKFS
jgi:hypothetical protein